AISHSTILIPFNSAGESVGSSPSLVILSDTEAEVMAIPVVLPEIAPEEAPTSIVAPPTATLDLAIESDPEVEPSKALPYEEPPSPDYVPSYPIHAPTSLDYHPKSDTESEPFEDDFEPIEDAPEAAKPLSAQVAPPPPVQISPTLPTSPTKHASVGPYRKRCRFPPPASTVPPPDVPRSDPTFEAIIPKFVIPEATTPVASVIRRSEPIHRTIPLLVARLVCLNGQIEEIHDHEREVLVARIESDEHEIETLLARTMWVEAQFSVL
ncbi:hypothetical protein Tco_1452513, partial [Tanacetum coccineum]